MPSSPDLNSLNCAMSVPAMNDLPPAPRNTTARTPVSLRSVAQISPSCSYICQVMALRAAGRSNVTWTTSPLRSVRTLPSLMRWLPSLAAAPDLLDHGGIGIVGLAGAHAGFEQRFVELQRRQRLAELAGELPHQGEVLQRLVHEAFGLELALDHLATLDVHHLRI